MHKSACFFAATIIFGQYLPIVFEKKGSHFGCHVHASSKIAGELDGPFAKYIPAGKEKRAKLRLKPTAPRTFFPAELDFADSENRAITITNHPPSRPDPASPEKD